MLNILLFCVKFFFDFVKCLADYLNVTYYISYPMKILQISLPVAFLFFVCGCTVTTTTDMNGNSTKSVSIGWSEPKAFGSVLSDSSFPKLQETNTSQNLFYFSGFGSHQPQLSTMDNIVQGEVKHSASIDVDFALSADYNQDASERYVLALRFEKDQFPYQPKTSDTVLTLSLDSEILNLNPNRVNDLSKTKTITKTVNGSTEQQKYDRHFLSIDFFIDEATIDKITHSKTIMLQLLFSGSETVSATLAKSNYVVLNEFSTVLKEVNESIAKN